ncbi:hypothetical protein [Agrobacterium rosae]|uniref:hypothetical protein n=1 Tax=Agrobacterium rosae TaxID=1972867 RepID=UPI000CD88310|nr:hypothetical protein [Agrobacterium rosae]POO56262.1 hypothetical protein CTT39_05875 [Agrobacterium rosae]
MAVDNYYDRAKELQAWALDMTNHIHEYHAASWRINFHIGKTFYDSQLMHLEDKKTDLTFTMIDDGNVKEINEVRFWAALDLFIKSYEYAVAYNHNTVDADHDGALEVVEHREDHILEFKAFYSLYDDHQGKNVNMRFRFFATKNEAMIWSMQLSNPELVGQNGSQIGPKFHWWK